MKEIGLEPRLAVLNDGEQGPTFQKAYIDTTLITQRTLGKKNFWRLISGLVTNKHALVETLVGDGNADEQLVRR